MNTQDDKKIFSLKNGLLIFFSPRANFECIWTYSLNSFSALSKTSHICTFGPQILASALYIFFRPTFPPIPLLGR